MVFRNSLLSDCQMTTDQQGLELGLKFELSSLANKLKGLSAQT